MNKIVNGDAVADEGKSFSLKPLMFETFVCTIAMMAFAALAGPLARQLDLAPWQMGSAVTVAGVAWVLMSRVWGGLSDRKGRRPIILFGLSGFVISYILLAVFIDFAMQLAIAPWLACIGLILCRGAAGAFYAAVPATSAALVADHIPPKKRASAMAAIGAASASGMVIGPGLAGLVGPFSLTLPLFVTAGLAFTALMVMWRVLPKEEAHVNPNANTVRLLDIRLRRPVVVAFVAAFSVAIAQIIVGFYALERLQLSTANAAQVAGIALATVGIALIFSQVVLRKLAWQPEQLIKWGGLIAAIGFISAVFAISPVMLCISYTIAGFGMGWIYPSVSALAANSVDEDEQGAAAGTIAAAQGFGIIIGPLVGTVIYAIEHSLPYALNACLLCLIAFWLSKYKKC